MVEAIPVTELPALSLRGNWSAELSAQTPGETKHVLGREAHAKHVIYQVTSPVHINLRYKLIKLLHFVWHPNIRWILLRAKCCTPS